MSVFGKLWTSGGSGGGGGNNRNFVGPGMGWYLDEDYLLTLGNLRLGSVVGDSDWVKDVNIWTTKVATGTAEVAWDAGLYNTQTHEYVSQSTGNISWNDSRIHNHTFSNAFIINDILALWYTEGSGPSDSYWHFGAEEDVLVRGTELYSAGTEIESWVSTNYSSMWVIGASPAPSVVTKIQYGSGAFAFTKFPVSGVDTYVGLGVSSVAGKAEIVVNGTSTSYTTRTLDGTTFTMYYTDQMAGDMTAYIPVIEVASMPSISNLSDYQTALFNAIVSASGLSVIT